jgi:iron complex outermembrane recepter protein
VPPRASDLSPSINEGWELGWKFKPVAWLEGRLASWTQIASNEVYRKLNDPSNDSANLGRTRRDGQDLQLNFRPGEALSGWATLSLQRALIVTPNPAAPETRGKEVDHVPHAMGSVGVSWRFMPAWTVSASARGQSSYFIESSNAQGRWGSFIDGDIGLAHQLNEQCSVDLQVKNIANARREYVWWDTTALRSQHGPADGRAVYLSASLRF